MTNLTVQERNSVLVIDSRLIAEELGIQHGDWLRNIVIKYKQEIENDFGVIRFENGKPIKGSRGGRPEQYAYLTEEQTTVLMTYSRNTEQVRQCKRNLVKAFTEAKKFLKEVTPAVAKQQTEIVSLPSAREQLETIKLGIDLFSELGGCDERTEILLKDRIRNILLENQLQPSLTEGNSSKPIRLEYPVSDRAIALGYRPNNSQLQQIGKCASRLYLEKYDSKPPQREQFVGGTTRMVNVYGAEDLKILDEAIFLVMDKAKIIAVN